MSEENKIGGVKEISVKAPKVERNFESTYDFGATLEEAVELFGEDVVFAGFVSSGVIDAQNFIRLRLEKKTEEGGFSYSDDAISADFAEWKPGIKSRERISPLDKIKKALGSLSEEQKAALLASLGA